MLTGKTQPVTRPPGDAPSSISTLPGLGSAVAGLAGSGVSTSALTGGLALDVPGQSATFRGAPLASAVTITGSSRIGLHVAGVGGTTEAVLFAKLYDVAADGRRSLPGGGVAAFRIPALPPDGATVALTLPGVVATVAAGHHLELVVTTTDQAYATPLTPAAYTIALAPDSAALIVPVVTGRAAGGARVPATLDHEASLRYLLAIPVPRARLQRQKAAAAGLLSLLALVLLPVVALAVGCAVYGGGGITSPLGDALGFGTGIVRLLLAVAYIAVSLLWVAGAASLLSVATDAPLGAVGGAVMITIVSEILDGIPALAGLRDWLPTHYAYSWTALLSADINWSQMTWGAFSALAYATMMGALAWWRFTTKDITS